MAQDGKTMKQYILPLFSHFNLSTSQFKSIFKYFVYFLFVFVLKQHNNFRHVFSPLFSGSYPSPKAGATLVMHKDLLVLFGGWTRPSPYPLHQPERFFDEIHTYSPSKNWWERLQSHDLDIVALVTITLQPFISYIFSSLLYFCSLCLRWNCIVTTHGPPPMAGHSSSVIGNSMVVFGGSLGARQMYDCMTYYLVSRNELHY